MGQQARNGRGVRPDRQTSSRRIRPGERSTPEPAESETAGRALTRRDPGARGFVLQGFDRATEELRVELHLKSVTIERLRAMFDLGDDRDLYNAYPIDHAKAVALEPFVSEKVDTDRYDFFLQRYG